MKLVLVAAASGPGLSEVDRSLKSALLLICALCACGGTSRNPRLELTVSADEGATQLAQASQSGDVETIRRLLGPKVVLGGLWFPDADCTREFAAPGEIGGGRLEELARCLTTVKLELTSHHSVFDDVAVLSYAPGIEVEARLVDTDHGTWLSWIGYADVREASDRLPTLTQAAFDALRDGSDAAPATMPQAHESAWLRVCIDATGHVTNAHIRSASSMEAGRMFAAAAQSWHFRPFSPAGQPLPACSLVSLPTAGPKSPGRPPTLPTPNGEPMLYGRLHRTQSGGFPVVTPALKRELNDRNIHELVTAIRLCVNERGEPYGVHLLRSSGVPSIDQGRLQAEQASRYEPYRDGDRPIAACTVDVSMLSWD